MITADCEAIRDDLDAFVDGELRGEALRYVSRHLDACRRCAEEIQVREQLGGLIRETVSGGCQAPGLDGLAAGVVARVRAESAMSWRALARRASEDWHWALVGGGAVTATFVSTLFCVSLVLLGMRSPSADSLSAMGQAMREPAGPLYAEVSRPGAGQNVIVVQLNTGDTIALAPPPFLTRRSEERQWVDALGEQLAGYSLAGGWESLTDAEREYTEWLLGNITRARLAEPSFTTPGALNVHRLHLVTNTAVTAKGLEP